MDIGGETIVNTASSTILASMTTWKSYMPANSTKPEDLHAKNTESFTKQATSFKRHVPMANLQAPSNKLSSPKHKDQASSHKQQAPLSGNHGTSTSQ